MEEILEKEKQQREEMIEKQKQDREQIKENSKKEKDKKIKKSFTILGISIWRILAYFIIYSVVGYLIETAFGALTKGVIESRKSFLYGPFCSIYGVGAVVMIIFLQYFRKNNYTLFAGGFIIGSIVEYLVSWVGEIILHVKWWDYSSVPLNIEGRVCVFFSLFWGILAIYLMSHVNPKIDELIDKIKAKFNLKFLKTITITMIILMFLDCVFTGFALRMFYTRITTEKGLELEGVEEYIVDYEKMYEAPNIKKFVDTYLNDEVMLKTFPNLKVTEKNGTIIYVSDLFTHIQPYYVRIFTPKVPGAVIEGN